MKTYKFIPFLLALFIIQCTSPEQKEAEKMEAVASAPILGGQGSIVDDVSAKNIVQIAAGSDAHTTLVAAIQAAGLVDVLANNGPLTVFAPTNEAFDNLPDGTVENLLKPENKMALVNLIHFHAAPGTYKGDLLKDGMLLYQAQGDKVLIERQEDESITVNGAKILATIDATNGVVHVVDKVLLPPDKNPKP
jgi:uncharacterized surface protein with fasciclin (FAS1) repeats